MENEREWEKEKEKGKERRVKSRLLDERDEQHALMGFELVGGDTQSADQTVKQRPALDRQKRREEKKNVCSYERFGKVQFQNGRKFLFVQKVWKGSERKVCRDFHFGKVQDRTFKKCKINRLNTLKTFLITFFFRTQKKIFWWIFNTFVHLMKWSSKQRSKAC